MPLIARITYCLGFLALLATTCAGVRAQQEANAAALRGGVKHPVTHKLRVAGLPNSGEVTPVLYRGGQPSKAGFRKLAKMGIDIVVDLRGSRESERKEVTRLGMRYVPMPWICFLPKDEVMAQFLELLRENPGKKVFVHCRTGDDRTGMMIAAYRIAEEGWTAAEARKEMDEYGFTRFHRTICPRLASYEQSFPERFRTAPAFEKLRSAQPVHEPR